jgi:hypothetical protein
MPEPDFEQLLTLLGQAIDAVLGSRRELEDAIGVGHGTLPRVLDGRLELKVRHVLALARVLEVPPGDFFALGCPKATASARSRLAARLGLPALAASAEAGAVGSAPSTPGALDELRPLLRQLIREEMAARPAAGQKRGAGSE